MSGEIRPFTPGDLDGAITLYVGVFNAEPWNDRWTIETARKRLAETFDTPGFLGVVAVENAEPIGFVAGYREQWFTGGHYYLKEMCVRTDRQRAGIGTRLIEHLERRLRDLDVERVYLLTARGGPAETFYAKRGYWASPKMIVMAHRLPG